MSDRNRILLIVALALVILLGAGAWLAFSDGGDDDDFTIEVLAADPQRHERTTTDRVDCPGGRGDSPLTTVEHGLGVTSVRSGYASGQLAAFTIGLTAEADAAEIDLSIIHEASFASGISCAFVDTSEPAAVEAGGGEDATATWTGTDDRSGVLTLTGIDAGEVIVVELWAEITADPESPRLPILLDVRGTDDVAVNDAILSYSASLQSPGTSPDISLDIAADVDRVTPPDEQVTQTVTLTNESSSDVADFAVLNGEVDNGGLLESLDWTDDEGSATECTTDVQTYSCDLGFVNPEETIELVAVLRAEGTGLPDDDGPPRPPTSECDLDVPFFCHEVEFDQQGPFTGARADAEAATLVIPGDQTFGISARSTTGEAVYAGTDADLDIEVAVIDGQTRAEDPVVTFSPCTAQETRYVEGDEDADNVMEPGETWLFRCRAEDLQPEPAFAVITATFNEQDIEEPVVAELTVIDESLAIEAVPVVDGSAWEVVNDGNVPIGGIEIGSGAEGCDPVVDKGDDPTPDLLDPEERWRITCASADAGLQVFGLDPLGGPVNAQSSS